MVIEGVIERKSGRVMEWTKERGSDGGSDLGSKWTSDGVDEGEGW